MSDIHAYRFGNVAIIDYLLTIVGAIILSMYIEVPLTIITVILLISAEILHLSFGIDTNTIRFLNGEELK